MLDDIELHDAQLISLRIDYAKRSAIVELSFYEDHRTADARRRATVSFCEVKSVSHVVDIVQLSDNLAAGNVTNWWPDVAKKTYIYLAGGCLIIEAETVEFQKTANL